VWLTISLVVMLEYLRTQEPGYLFELGGLLSLLWAEFGFAGIFHTIRKERGRKVASLLLVTILPPMALFVISLAVAWWLGKLAYISFP